MSGPSLKVLISLEVMEGRYSKPAAMPAGTTTEKDCPKIMEIQKEEGGTRGELSVRRPGAAAAGVAGGDRDTNRWN